MKLSKIPFSGGLIRSCQCVPLKSILLDVQTIAADSAESSSTYQYKLLFYKAAASNWNVDLRKSTKLESISIIEESKYRTNILKRLGETAAIFDNSKLKHFKLKLDRGEIDIVADGVSWELIWQA